MPRPISPLEAQALYKRGALLVDVREPEAFSAGSLSPAVNVPLSLVQAGKHGLPRERPLVLICFEGRMSELAGLYLEAEGYREIYNLEAGLAGWPPGQPME